MASRIALLLAATLSVGGATGQTIRGTIEERSFLGPVTQRPVLFNVYLPPGYASSSQRYPVVYHLHGLGGSQGGPQNRQVAAEFELAESAGVLGPVIIVFPNGYTNSFWADSISGHKPAETNVVRELVPHVDANFRTLPDRGFRVIEGFSMGGFGAAKFITKFPELFSTGIVYDGAMLTWPNMLAFQPQIAQEIFGGSEAYFDQFSPWRQAVLHAPVLRRAAALRSVVGALVPANRLYRDLVVSLSVPLEYAESGCEHVLPCVMTFEGHAAQSLIARRLPPLRPGDLNCDGLVNFDDIPLFVTALGDAAAYMDAAPDCTRLNADTNGDLVVDFDDIDRFVELLATGGA